MLRHVRLGTLVALFVGVTAVAVAAAPFAYITNSGSGTVSVIDLATNSVAGTIPVGILPFGVAMSPDGSRAYVANLVSGTVSVINTATNTVAATITVGGNPFGLALNPAGTRLYVARSGNGSVGVYDTATGGLVALVSGVGSVPRGVAVAPDGSRVIVTTRFGATFAAVIDAETNTVTTMIAGASGGAGIIMSPDGSRAYVASEFSNLVAIIDMATTTLAGTVFVGTGPMGLALNASGTRLYVANSGSNSVSVVDTVAKMELTQIPVGASPHGVSLGPDGSRLYVVNRDSGTVSVVNTATNAVVDTVAVGSLPMSFGTFIYRPAAVDTALQPTVIPGLVVLGSSGPVTFSATLTRGDSGAAVAGGTVTFTVDGTAAGSAVTGSDGVAGLSFNPSGLGAGMHTVQAGFAGGALNGATFNASAASGALHLVYKFIGFLPPVGEGVNDKKVGSMVIVKWRLASAAGTPITALGAVEAVRFGLMACGGTAPTAWTAAAGTLKYDPAEDQFMFQWRTEKAWAGQCFRLALALNDGTVHSADFSFK